MCTAPAAASACLHRLISAPFILVYYIYFIFICLVQLLVLKSGSPWGNMHRVFGTYMRTGTEASRSPSTCLEVP
jgi:hypothetical protein